jgi:hypothetical protein
MDNWFKPANHAARVVARRIAGLPVQSFQQEEELIYQCLGPI